jgi:hypothetical protein
MCGRISALHLRAKVGGEYVVNDQGNRVSHGLRSGTGARAVVLLANDKGAA